VTSQRATAADEARALAAGRAAGYCWAPDPSGPARCTRLPGHPGDHVDYYTGRKKVTDASGFSWPQ
jgi:hypothetical protein